MWPVISSGSYIDLTGLAERAKIQLFWAIRKYGCLAEHNRDKVWTIACERSPPYIQSLIPDVFTACCPKNRRVIVSYRLKRLSIMLVPEILLGQQLHLYDFFGADRAKWVQLLERWNHSLVMRMNGNAYHSSCIGSYTIASLLTTRMQSFGKVAYDVDGNDE